MRKELSDLIPLFGWLRVGNKTESESLMLLENKEIIHRTLIKEELKNLGYTTLIGLYNAALISLAYKVWYDSLPINN